MPLRRLFLYNKRQTIKVRGLLELTTIQIRKSQKDDFSQLVEMDNQIWHSENSPSPIHWQSIEDYAERCPEGSQLVAVMGEQVCGYAGLRQPTELKSNEHVAEISIAVHPNYRRMWVAKRLMDAICEIARKHRKRKLSLRVLASNHAAIRLYESCGFRVQGRLIEEFLLDGKYIDDLLMYKIID